MTRFDDLHRRDAPSLSATPNEQRRSLATRAVLIAAALLGGLAVAAGGLAYAATLDSRGDGRLGHRLERVQRVVHGALDSVGATVAQEDKVHDVIAKGFASLASGGMDRVAMRKQVLDLVRSPTIDRVAIEKVRAEQVARFDENSKAVTGMVLDAADQLTADQRASLADRVEAMMMSRGGAWRLSARAVYRGGTRHPTSRARQSSTRRRRRYDGRQSGIEAIGGPASMAERLLLVDDDAAARGHGLRLPRGGRLHGRP